eukprot:438340_1
MIKFVCYQYIYPDKYKWAPSLLIDDNLLFDIYSYLCNVKDKQMQIMIAAPKNSKSSLETLINKNSETYRALGYKLETGKNYSPRVIGTCDIFYIIHNNKKPVYWA